MDVGAVRHDEKGTAAAPLLDDRARACGKELSLLAQHDHIAEGSLGFHRSELQQCRRIDAAAPWRGQDGLKRNPF